MKRYTLVEGRRHGVAWSEHVPPPHAIARERYWDWCARRYGEFTEVGFA